MRHPVLLHESCISDYYNKYLQIFRPSIGTGTGTESLKVNFHENQIIGSTFSKYQFQSQENSILCTLKFTWSLISFGLVQEVIYSTNNGQMLTILWHLWISIVFFAQRADFLHGHMLTDFYRDFGARKARRDASKPQKVTQLRIVSCCLMQGRIIVPW